MKKVILLALSLIIAACLCACRVEKEPTALEKAKAEADAARDALESISGAVDEAEDRLDWANSLFN